MSLLAAGVQAGMQSAMLEIARHTISVHFAKSVSPYDTGLRLKLLAQEGI